MKRDPGPLPFLLVLLGVVALALVWAVADRFVRPRPAELLRPDVVDPSWSVSEVVTHVLERNPGWRAVPYRDDGTDAGGVFLCDGPRDRGDLTGLPVIASKLDQWSGVVLCQRVPATAQVYDDGWGDAAYRAGPFLFFGDPRMVDAIRQAVR